MSIIKYSNDNVIVIDISEGIYLIKLSDIPKIYNIELNIVEYKNINYWLKKRTNFTYEQILMMADAYRDGINNGYSLKDIKLISRMMISATRDAIFKTDFVIELSSIYWIELMDIDKLNKFIQTVRNNWDRLLEKYGEDELYNVMCRLWQFCNTCYPDKAHVFESIIRNRLRKIPKLPEYPNCDEIDYEIETIVFGIVFDNRYGEFKNVDNKIWQIAEKVNQIE